MKYYTFYRENNNFDDILNDLNLKKLIDNKIRWKCHLMIGIEDTDVNDQTFSYITLKYGDEMVQDLIHDFSPIPGVDYTPEKDKNLFTKSIT